MQITTVAAIVGGPVLIALGDLLRRRKFQLAGNIQFVQARTAASFPAEPAPANTRPARPEPATAPRVEGSANTIHRTLSLRHGSAASLPMAGLVCPPRPLACAISSPRPLGFRLHH